MAHGGFMTLDETGMIDALMADYYFMSTNTMTIDGELVNIDGNGNRVAALIYSPENVIILAGMNKVAMMTVLLSTLDYRFLQMS